MRRFLAALIMVAAVLVVPVRPASAAVTPPQIYGAWHCGNDFCTWGAVRTVAAGDGMVTSHFELSAGYTAGASEIS